MQYTAVKTQPFTIQHRVYFNETNALGGVAYFSNYIKWQGMAREEYFIQTVPSWREIVNLTITGQLNMVTAEEHSHFIQHAFFGDQVTIQLFTSNIKRYSFDMLFFMYNTEFAQLLYEGIQKLAFDNFRGKFEEIPPAMLQSVRRYAIQVEDVPFSRLSRYMR